MTRQNRRNSLIKHRGNGAINYTSCMGIGGHIPSHPAKPNRTPSREDARAKLRVSEYKMSLLRLCRMRVIEGPQSGIKIDKT
nr:MAG TPA: hypothetical protein [Caudoviricetes sp.]